MSDLVERLRNVTTETTPAQLEAADELTRLYAEKAELVEALAELDAAVDDGLCNSGTPGFDAERLERAQKAAKAVLSRAHAENTEDMT